MIWCLYVCHPLFFIGAVVLLQVLCLWDLSSQLCLHRLTTIFPMMQEGSHTLLSHQEQRQRLLLSFNSLLFLLEVSREEKSSRDSYVPLKTLPASTDRAPDLDG